MFFPERPRRHGYGDAIPRFHIQSAEVRISLLYTFYIIASAALCTGDCTVLPRAARGKKPPIDSRLSAGAKAATKPFQYKLDFCQSPPIEPSPIMLPSRLTPLFFPHNSIGRETG